MHVKHDMHSFWDTVSKTQTISATFDSDGLQKSFSYDMWSVYMRKTWCQHILTQIWKFGEIWVLEYWPQILLTLKEVKFKPVFISIFSYNYFYFTITKLYASLCMYWVKIKISKFERGPWTRPKIQRKLL